MLLTVYKELLPNRQFLVNTGTHGNKDGVILSELEEEEIKKLDPSYFEKAGMYLFHQLNN